MAAPTLYQFSYSPYCEKVRWALDYKTVPWHRESMLWGPHLPRMLAMTGQRYVPVLEFGGGERILDSTRIIKALEDRHPTPALYPSKDTQRERALRIEDFCDEELGPPLKRVMLFHLLPHTRYLSTLLSVGSGSGRRRTYRAMFAGVRIAMRTAMGLTARRMDKAQAQLDSALDRLESEIASDGYLVGGAFSIADLTAAAMLSPLLPPPFTPYRLQDSLPTEARAHRDAYAQRRAITWACEIYEKHRGVCMSEDREFQGSRVI